MKQTKLIMGMPITIEIVDEQATKSDLERIFAYFVAIDNKFSTYKPTSEISKFNDGQINRIQLSQDMRTIFALSEDTKRQTGGYFEIHNNDNYDPSGLVKGWAIHNAAKLLKRKGFRNFYIEAGGDIQVSGKNAQHQPWRIGIQNPFNSQEIIKILQLEEQGIATSGTYIRGQHIYNPHSQIKPTAEIVSLTVIGPNIYEADRFATAAFAMGEQGIQFIESLPNCEGYMIDKQGMATSTSNFNQYTVEFRHPGNPPAGGASRIAFVKTKKRFWTSQNDGSVNNPVN